MAMPSADEILSGIRTWVELESPTQDPVRVNQMMDMVMAEFEGMGASTRRIPGTDGRGDHVSVSSPWGGDEKGILVLSHLDTVHPVGTIEDLPYYIEGDKAYGPGMDFSDQCRGRVHSSTPHSPPLPPFSSVTG